MDDPTDLSARRPGDGWSPGDDDVVRSVRAALGESAPARPGERAPRELLLRLERRAARHHRRRQVVALAGAAAAAVVVVTVGGLVLPQLTSLSAGESSSSAAGSGADAGGGGGAGGAAAADSRSAQAPVPAASAESQPQGLYSSATTAAVPLTSASMLTAQDVTAFEVEVRDEQPVDDTGSPLPLTACTDGDAGIVTPVSLWRVDLVADPAAATGTEPPGLVERVARFSTPAEASAAVQDVEARVSSCSGPGLEGTGPTTELDATSLSPNGGQALVLGSTTGQGSPALRLYLVSGTTLVQLEVTSDAASTEDALADVADTARVAVERAAGPAGAP